MKKTPPKAKEAPTPQKRPSCGALGGQQEKIYALLRKAARPLSAYDLLAALKGEGVRSPPIVYRALEKLQEKGLVHRVESLGAFVACCHHHGHDPAQPSPLAICRSCGVVQEVDDPALARAFQKMGQGFLAQVDHKVLEISGLCQTCQKGKG